MSGEALLGWLPFAAVVLLVLLWYLTYTASRLDRLHHRVESSRAALDAHLARRAAMALEAAALVDPATGLILAGAAGEVLGLTGGEPPAPSADVEQAESDLTQALVIAFDDPATVAELRHDPLAADVLADLARACTRAALARRFLNDAVASAQRLRRKRVVRWARLAGRAAMPQMVELDDAVPAGLAAP